MITKLFKYILMIVDDFVKFHIGEVIKHYAKIFITLLVIFLFIFFSVQGKPNYIIFFFIYFFTHLFVNYFFSKI